MRRMFNKEENEEAKARDLKSLSVQVWVKDGKIDHVNENDHLGSLLMPETSPNVFECVGAYGRPVSKIPVKFELKSLGTVTPKTQIVEGMHTETEDVKFNALEWLDEPEKLAALSEAEKEELKNIGVVELNNRLIAMLEKTPEIDPETKEQKPREWNAFADAAMAIMQHDDGSEGRNAAFPKPVVTQIHNTITVDGDHSDGSEAILTVNGKEFTVGGEYYFHTSYLLCNGFNEYWFIWMQVPVAFLDEPKEIVVPVKPWL